MKNSLEIWSEMNALHEKRIKLLKEYKAAQLAEAGCGIGDEVQEDATGKVYKVSGWHVCGGDRCFNSMGYISGYPRLKNGSFGVTEKKIFCPVTVIKHA